MIKLQQPKLPADLTSIHFSEIEETYIHQSVISDCTIMEKDLGRLRFDQVVFKNEANFAHTPLKGVDLRICHFERITASIDDLAGCEVTGEQAIGFARMMGLIIKE